MDLKKLMEFSLLQKLDHNLHFTNDDLTKALRVDAKSLAALILR
ncbi:Uncharacterised protein [Shewanella algae]|uniref:Uncharacterized protein n=1 Tax=Shewanella algae TaxID=38313 RepID=A0A380BFY1_9GAMM|nr:Uncharacterised protein [Shewanella algae]